MIRVCWCITEILSTWSVPQGNTVYFIKLADLPTKVKGRELSLIYLCRGVFYPHSIYTNNHWTLLQNQESWGGSSGHFKGDAWVYGLHAGEESPVHCWHTHLKYNGIDTCQSMDSGILKSCEHYKLMKKPCLTSGTMSQLQMKWGRFN